MQIANAPTTLPVLSTAAYACLISSENINSVAPSVPPAAAVNLTALLRDHFDPLPPLSPAILLDSNCGDPRVECILLEEKDARCCKHRRHVHRLREPTNSDEDGNEEDVFEREGDDDEDDNGEAKMKNGEMAENRLTTAAVSRPKLRSDDTTVAFMAVTTPAVENVL